MNVEVLTVGQAANTYKNRLRECAKAIESATYNFSVDVYVFPLDESKSIHNQYSH